VQRQSASERALGEQQEMVASLEAELEVASHSLVLRGVEVSELQQHTKYLREELMSVGEAHKSHLAKLQKQIDDAHLHLKVRVTLRTPRRYSTPRQEPSPTLQT
jgi:predicted  nucleic acid-binding Zn-ribbon protein